MFNKRGQITIFIILSIFIVGVAFLFFMIEKNITSSPLETESSEVHNFVSECIEKEGSKMIYEVADGGGYFFPPEFSTNSGAPIYYESGKNFMPLKEDIENEISFFVDEVLFFCTRNFVDFHNLNISQGEIKTATTILDERVILEVEYPISISKGENIVLFREFSVEIPVRMGIVYESVNEYMNQQIKSEGICLTCLLEISLEKDLYINLVDYDEETTIFIFRDENSKLNNETLTWVFGNKYE